MNQGNEARRQGVEKARDYWVNRLIDLSRRNNLLYYRDLKKGTIDLTDANASAFQGLLTGKSLPLDKLLPEADEIKLPAMAREIYRRARSRS